MSFFLAACAFSLVVYIMLFGALWVQDRKDLANRSLRWFIASLVVWVCAELLESPPAMHDQILLLQRLMTLGWGTSTFFFLMFVYAFTGRKLGIAFHAQATASTIVVLVGSSTNLVISDVSWTVTGAVGRPGPAYWPAVTIVTLNGVIALSLLIHSLVREPNQRQRSAIATVVVGGIVTLLTALLVDVVIPYVLNVQSWPQFACCIGTVFCAVVWVAMMRHDFLSTTLEQIAEDLFARSGEGIALVDAAQMVRRINPAATAMLGLPTSGGPWIADVVLPGFQPGATFSQRVIELESAGEKRVVSLSQSTREGVRTGYATVLVYRDITEEQRIHTRLEEERTVLEREVARRTAELERTREREALGAVASSVIHDFNNQLFPIISIAELVREDLPEEHPAVRDIDDLILAATQAADVGRQLLGFTRRVEARKGIVDLAALSRDVHHLLESSAKKNIALSCVIEDDPATVIGTMAQLRQALVNISTNALEALGDQGGKVELRLWRSKRPVQGNPARADSGAEFFLVTVSDDGPGIPSDRVAQVFAPFFTTKGGLGRSGLGLTVALHIAEQHGGTIEIASTQTKGASVSLVLPCLARPSWLSELQGNSTLFGSERILVLASPGGASQHLPEILAPLGYQLVVLQNDSKAHRVLRSDPAYYDLFILDSNAGHETIRELVETATLYRPDVKILELCSDAELAQIPELWADSVRRISKTAPRLEIARAVRNVLGV